MQFFKSQPPLLIYPSCIHRLLPDLLPPPESESISRADALESPSPSAVVALECFYTWLDLANLVAASSFPFVAAKLAAVLLRDFLRAMLLPALLASSSSSATATAYHSPSSASSSAASADASGSGSGLPPSSPMLMPASVATAYVRRLVERWDAPALRTMLIEV
jgi:hypothetical protein